MAAQNVKPNFNRLKSKPYADGSLQATRKTEWFVGKNAPRTVDELSFTARNALGHMVWWNVQPPKTDYWHVHEMLGKAYAYEVLDLLNNPDAEDDVGDGQNEYVLGQILNAIANWQASVAGTSASGIAMGFFNVIGEYVATGAVDR